MQKVKEHGRLAEGLKTGQPTTTMYLRHHQLIMPVRLNIRTLGTDYDKTEDDMKALQSVGQVIGEILKQLDEERCKLRPHMVKVSY